MTFIDEQIGKILTELKEKGQFNNLIIILTSNHGNMLADHHH